MPPSKLYMSMTVMPDRLVSEFFRSVISHLKAQTTRFDKIIINIPFIYKRTNTKYVIPQWLQAEPLVLINRCHDLGPATKLLGSYHQFKAQDIVSIVDDDIVYRPNMLENLVAALQHYPDALISTKLDEQGSPSGYSGYIFQRKTLDITEADLRLLLRHCFCVDDTWLGKIAKQKQIPVLALSKY